MRRPLTGSGHTDNPTTPSSVTALRASSTAMSTSCSVNSPDAFMRSGRSPQKSAIQSFHARQRSLAYSGSKLSSQWSGEVRNITATSSPSLSMATTCDGAS